MPKDWPLLIATILVVLGLLAAYLYSFRYVLVFEFTDEAVRVKLFGRIVVRTIPVRAIDEIAIVSTSSAFPFSRDLRLGALFFGEHWAGYVPRRRAVRLHKRTGLSRWILLTPRDPAAFRDAVLAAQRRVQ